MSDDVMMHMAHQVRTRGAFLEIEIHPLDEMQAGWIVEIVSDGALVLSASEDVARREAHEREAWLTDRPLGDWAKLKTVRRLAYGSPLEVVLNAAPAVASSAAAVTALIFGIKRFFALDLELKTQREEQRRLFYEAKLRALEAHRLLEDTTSTTTGDRTLNEIAQLPARRRSWRGTATLVDVRDASDEA